MTLIALGLSTSLARSSAADPLSTVRRDLGELASQRTLLVLAAGGVMAGACAVVEDPLSWGATPEEDWRDGAADLGTVWGSVATLGAASGAALLAGHLAHEPTLFLTGAEMARALAYSTVAVVALKLAVERTRPNGEPYSFPSGHSAAAFSVAPVLGARFGVYAAVPAYMLATLTAIGRVEDHKHFPSDVVFGAAIGLASGFAVTESDAQAHRVSLVVRPEGIGLATRF